MHLDLGLIVIDIVGPLAILFSQDMLDCVPGGYVGIKETDRFTIISRSRSRYPVYYPDVFHNVLLLLVIQAISWVTETFSWEALRGAKIKWLSPCLRLQTFPEYFLGSPVIKAAVMNRFLCPRNSSNIFRLPPAGFEPARLSNAVEHRKCLTQPAPVIGYPVVMLS
jgi:hypothetical protein